MDHLFCYRRSVRGATLCVCGGGLLIRLPRTPWRGARWPLLHRTSSHPPSLPVFFLLLFAEWLTASAEHGKCMALGAATTLNMSFLPPCLLGLSAPVTLCGLRWLPLWQVQYSFPRFCLASALIVVTPSPPVLYDTVLPSSYSLFFSCTTAPESDARQERPWSAHLCKR
jgi:hypothetical protein